jgi:molybdate transport system permease protein
MALNWFPLWLSLRVAALATVAAAALGLWLADLLANRRFRGKDVLDTLIALPLVLPAPVLGYYLLVLLSQASPLGRLYESAFGVPLVFTWQAAVVASTVHAIPLFVKSVRAAFEGGNQRYERAARTLGASDWRVFWRVTLPLSRRAVIAASLVAFARALGDFGATLIVAGNIPGKTQTASIAIYDAVERGNSPVARVFALVLCVLTIAIVYAANRIEQPPVPE